MLKFISIIPLITICCLWPYNSYSQDIIKKNNGEEIKTKVVEIGDTLVKYKKFDDPEFATYTILKKDIKTIQYESGKTINPNKRYKESYLSLWIGPSMPFGNYASGDPNRNTSGFAKTGFGSSLEFGFKFAKNLGLSINLGSFYNLYDHDQLDKQLKSNVGFGEKISTNYSSFTGKFLLLGIQYYTPISKRFTLVNKISIGSMTFSKPEFDYHYTDSSANATATATAPISYYYTSSQGNGHSIASGVGTALWFKLSNRFLLKASADIVIARPNVHFNTKSNGSGIYGSNMTPDGNYNKIYKVNIVNAGLSMIFLLRKKR